MKQSSKILFLLLFAGCLASSMAQIRPQQRGRGGGGPPQPQPPSIAASQAFYDEGEYRFRIVTGGDGGTYSVAITNKTGTSYLVEVQPDSSAEFGVSEALFSDSESHFVRLLSETTPTAGFSEPVSVTVDPAVAAGSQSQVKAIAASKDTDSLSIHWRFLNTTGNLTNLYYTVGQAAPTLINPIPLLPGVKSHDVQLQGIPSDCLQIAATQLVSSVESSQGAPVAVDIAVNTPDCELPPPPPPIETAPELSARFLPGLATLEWTDDVVYSEYTVFWGTASGSYTDQLEVSGSSVTLSSLLPSTQYFFSVGRRLGGPAVPQSNEVTGQIGQSATSDSDAPETGFPRFGTFLGEVNIENLNVNVLLPITRRPGRGIDFAHSIVYNSSFWRPANGAWSSVGDWGWRLGAVLGDLEFDSQHVLCREGNVPTGGSEAILRNFRYVDAVGTVHPFDVEFNMLTPPGGDNCDESAGSRTGYATDGSGYYLDATDHTDIFVKPSTSHLGVLSESGIRVDRNGNAILRVDAGEDTTVWTDTLGHPALRISEDSSAGTIAYEYLDDSGEVASNGDTTILMSLVALTVSTDFSCPGVTDVTEQAIVPSSLIYPNGDQYTFAYDTNGRVTTMTLPSGGTISYEYFGPNSGVNCTDGSTTGLRRVVDDAASTATWEIVREKDGTDPWRTTVRAPQMPYDAEPNTTIHEFVDGRQVREDTYQGHETGNLLQTVETTYDEDARPASETTTLDDGKQSKTETVFDEWGNITELREYEFTETGFGSPARTTVFTHETSVDYVNEHIRDLVTEITVFDGDATTGTLRSRTEFGYDEYDVVPMDCSMIDDTGESVIQHDSAAYPCDFEVRGNLTSITTYPDVNDVASAITRTRQYDVLGNLQKSDLDCCNQMEWEYDPPLYAWPARSHLGPSSGDRLTEITDRNVFTGATTSLTAWNSGTRSFSYDSKLRLSEVTPPSPAPTTISYDDVARTTTTTRPVQGLIAQKETTHRDGLGRVNKIVVTDQDDEVISAKEVAYDPLGRPYMASQPYEFGPAIYWTETRYDALGRPVLVIPPFGDSNTNAVTYAYSGNSVISTDAVGRQQKITYGALGTVEEVIEPDDNSPPGLTLSTSYEYTMVGHIASVTQGSQSRTYDYDDVGRLTSQTTPEGGTVSFGYTPFGAVETTTDARGVITNYTYDELHRPSTIVYDVDTNQTSVASTAPISFSYFDSASPFHGMPMEVIYGNYEVEYKSYDDAKQLTELDQTLDGAVYTLAIDYDDSGTASDITLPSGFSVHADRGAHGDVTRIASATDIYLDNVVLNPSGQPTGLEFGNGVMATHSYDPGSQLIGSIEFAKNATTLFSTTYKYDHGVGGISGQITGVDDQLAPERSATYAYDSMARLKSASIVGGSAFPAWGLSWTYDRYGNRISQAATQGSPPIVSYTALEATNRVAGLSYDANGNVLDDGNAQYSYDAANRLVSMTIGGITTDYGYDTNGLRVKESAPAKTTTYLRLGPSVLAEYDGTSPSPASPDREFVYWKGRRIAEHDRSALELTYRHYDHFSTRLVTSDTGDVVSEQGHYPFGETWYQTGETDTVLGNYERSSEAVPDYAFYRNYDFSLGRFTSPDPIQGGPENPQSWNRYAYVLNDPVNLTDPLGLAPCPPLVCFDTDDGERICIKPECVYVSAPFPEENPFAIGGKIEQDALEKLGRQMRERLESKGEPGPRRSLKGILARLACQAALTTASILADDSPGTPQTVTAGGKATLTFVGHLSGSLGVACGLDGTCGPMGSVAVGGGGPFYGGASPFGGVTTQSRQELNDLSSFVFGYDVAIPGGAVGTGTTISLPVEWDGSVLTLSGDVGYEQTVSGGGPGGIAVQAAAQWTWLFGPEFNVCDTLATLVED